MIGRCSRNNHSSSLTAICHGHTHSVRDSHHSPASWSCSPDHACERMHSLELEEQLYQKTIWNQPEVFKLHYDELQLLLTTISVKEHPHRQKFFTKSHLSFGLRFANAISLLRSNMSPCGVLSIEVEIVLANQSLDPKEMLRVQWL